MFTDDKKKKKRHYRQKQPKQPLPVNPPSPVNSQETTAPGNDVRPQPFTFFNQQQPAQQQPIIAQEATPPTNQQPNQQNSLPPSGMQSLVTQGYDPTMLMQSIVNSPTLARIRENDEKIARLKETPVQDKDGFWWSLAKAGMSGLAEAFNPNNPIRNEGDFYNRIGYAAGKTIGGGVNRKWNEVQNIQNEVARTYQENEILQERAKQEFEMQQKAAQFATTTQKAVDYSKSLEQRSLERDRQLDLGEAKFAFQKLNSQQQNLLKIIGKQEFYKPGADAALDKELADARMVIPEFDARTPITKTEAGKTVQWDYDNRIWKDAVGVPINESEVPISFSIDNVRIKLRPRDIASLKAAEQRQQTEIEYKKNKDKEDSKMKWDMWKMRFIQQKEEEKNRNTFNKVKDLAEIDKAYKARDITEEHYLELKAILEGIN